MDTAELRSILQPISTEDKMKSRCTTVAWAYLSDLIPRITGYVQFSLDSTSANWEKWSSCTSILWGCFSCRVMKDNSAMTTALLIDHNIQVPARFIDRLNKRKIDAEQNPQHHKHRALHHLDDQRLPQRRTAVHSCTRKLHRKSVIV